MIKRRRLAWSFVVVIWVFACSQGCGGDSVDIPAPVAAPDPVSPPDPAPSPRPAELPPNIIVMLADDLGYADVGFHGSLDIPTPHIDTLARNGIRFASGYVSHSICSPSRAGLLTGRYPQRLGHEANPVFAPENPSIGLPVGETTLAQLLQEAGYVTGVVGKWHLGAHPEFHPNVRGFDEFFGFLGGGHRYIGPWQGETEYTVALLRDDQPVERSGYLTDILAEEAAGFIARQKDRAFLLYLAFNAPHTPMQATEEYLARFPTISDPLRQTYAAMVSAMDDAVGCVLSALREHGLETHTLIFFLSDNGGPVREGFANGSSNTPLRGDKGTLFEGGIRVPFVAQWRGTMPEGEVYSEPVSSLDIFATSAALAGVSLPSSLKIDGVDLMPYLTGEEEGPPHDRLYWRYARGRIMAMREGRWKLLLDAERTPHLFDLDTDPEELNNVAAQNPDTVDRLVETYAEWNRHNPPPAWVNP